MKLDRSNRIPPGTHAVLDVGSSKIVCFIAEVDAAGIISVKGIGHQLSRGVRASAITDFSEAETSITAAVHAAEQMADMRIEDVVVSLSGHGLRSKSVTVEMGLQGEEVSDRDILDILSQGRSSIESDDEEILHCFPTSYVLDDNRGITDPRHMVGSELAVELHVVTAPSNLIQNLSRCISRCHLNITGFVAAPHASALACLDDDEMELGVTVIDIGGGNTSFSVFYHGRNIYTDMVPVGGGHVTSDIAKGLSTTLAHAERLKTLHGSCITSSSDDQVMISAPVLGEDDESEEENTMPRGTLVSIVRPRMEEIFEMIRSNLEANDMDQFSGRRVVITGGGSQLIGVRELSSRMFGKHVRIGKPKPITGMAEAASGPSFATAIGMLQLLNNKTFEELLYEESTAKKTVGQRLKSIFGLVKEDF